jgi:hypothetical protein
MIVKPKTACGDEDDLFSNLGPCSDFYVSKRVPTTKNALPIRNHANSPETGFEEIAPR